VHRVGAEGIRAAHDGADVHVVLPVLDGDVKGVAGFVEVGRDGFDGPVAVPVDDVAAVAPCQQLRVVLLALWQLASPRSDAVGGQFD
jgi:hypothetical protein